MTNEINLIECPRDAMQGWPHHIPTEVKINYINSLLQVGFDTIDFGSFVSAKAIPQMADTRAVLEGLDLSKTKSKLLAIIANVRGAEEAAAYEEISYLGFPFSVSQEFQRRNTNSTIEESLVRVEEIQDICSRNKKELVVYLSMGFGNPYGEDWSPEIVIKWAKKIAQMGIKKIALSDTVGVGNPQKISLLFSQLIPEIKSVEFGAHLHSHSDTWLEKIEAAVAAGCTRFDSAMKGIGGCPMAEDVLVGNMATENIVSYFGGPAKIGLDEANFNSSMLVASEIFL